MTGWSLKRIEHEAAKRRWGGFEDPDTFHPARDLAKQQDWEWAVDRLARRMEISSNQRAAASKFYEAGQTLLGDPPPRRGLSLVSGKESETIYERAHRIWNGGLNYVFGHPDLTPLRRHTFDKLFAPSQPTLEQVRSMNGKRTNQREAIARIRWCCEVLANHFDGQEYPKEAAVNEKQMGVGEGWTLVDHISAFPANYIDVMQARGYQIFQAPSGNVYARNPKELSVFEPLDATPQIAASKV